MVKHFFYLMLLGALISGCDAEVVRGSGQALTEERDVAPFDTVMVDQAFDVTVQQGGYPKIHITADHNLTKFIVAKVENRILRFEQTKKLQTKNPIQIKLVSPDIKEITHISTSNIYISIVDSQELTINNKNAGQVLASGQVGHLNLNIEGDGNTIFSQLKAKSVRVMSTGSARVDVFASESIEANNSGAGTVTVFGSPDSVTEENKGAGLITIK